MVRAVQGKVIISSKNPAIILQFTRKLHYICSTNCKHLLHMSQATISIRVDQSLKQSFDSLCEDFGISTTAAFNIFMKTVVRERRIPFEIRSESEAQKRQNAIDAFAAMRAAVAASGMKEMSLEEINAEIKEARNARRS